MPPARTKDRLLDAAGTVVMRDGATVSERPMSAWTEQDLVQAMVARNLDSFYPWEPRDYGPVVLEVRDLASPPIVRHASFKRLTDCARATRQGTERASRLLVPQ